MDISIRRGRLADHPAILEVDGASFGFDYDEQEAELVRTEVAPEQFLVAVDDADQRIVGVTADLDLAVILPGRADAPMCGVTWVSVEVTHRRRGVMRALLERQLREHASSGAVASVLIAAEAGIYGRFGFGMATRSRDVLVDRARARLARPVDTSAVRRLSTDAAAVRLPDLYDRWRERTPGAVSRSSARWELLLRDRPERRGGWTALRHLVHPDGYVSFRVKTDWVGGEPKAACRIVDYAPVTDEAHAALWQTLLALDLVGPIESGSIPVDDPLPWLLTDLRQVRTTTLRDGMFVRPLDVPGLLAARRYADDIRAVFEVADPLFGDGRYLLRGGLDAATCTRTERLPDVRLSVAALGAASLGGVRLGELARAGLVDCSDEHLLRRLDRTFLADRAPAFGTSF